jgi:hypothetical protein
MREEAALIEASLSAAVQAEAALAIEADRVQAIEADRAQASVASVEAPPPVSAGARPLEVPPLPPGDTGGGRNATRTEGALALAVEGKKKVSGEGVEEEEELREEEYERTQMGD